MLAMVEIVGIKGKKFELYGNRNNDGIIWVIAADYSMLYVEWVEEGKSVRFCGEE